MSTLLLARHGQAAAFEADSDRLTELGKVQARKLGEYLARNRVEFDEAHQGTLRRHRETAHEVEGAYREAGLPFPERRESAGWNEYDAPGVTGVLAKKLATEDTAFAALTKAFQAAAHDPKERNRHFQRMFEVVMSRWASGDLAAPGVESFASFHERSSAAYGAVLSDNTSRRVIVFTSGGPIGVCIQRTLQAPPSMALEINWRVRNTSLSEFIFSKGRASLDSFNHIPHLEDVALRTFR